MFLLVGRNNFTQTLKFLDIIDLDPTFRWIIKLAWCVRAIYYIVLRTFDVRRTPKGFVRNFDKFWIVLFDKTTQPTDNQANRRIANYLVFLLESYEVIMKNDDFMLMNNTVPTEDFLSGLSIGLHYKYLIVCFEQAEQNFPWRR